MTELTIYGRGGQGGVTLAKLIATAYFLRGQFVQAFGVYAAERSGAPLQAFVRVDNQEIVNHNQVTEPNHVVVLDRTLIAPRICIGMKPEGSIILNTPEAPDAFAALFPGHPVACVDATKIAMTNGLGTRAVPIVNTTILGAVARVLGLSIEDITAALRESKFGGANIDAARQAFEATRLAQLPGSCPAIPPMRAHIAERAVGLLDDEVGAPPAIHTGAWANRQPHRQQLTPPCNHACPAGNDVQAFVAATGRREIDVGLQILLRTTPFPGVCGRVCPAPCMASCNRGEFDESVNVKELERYAADHGAAPRAQAPWRAEEVAVIGSGPAGLAAAYHLAKLGYPVTLFEAARELGGVMRNGIPAYRLPPDVLDREIAFILDHGVKSRTQYRVDRGKLLDMTRWFAAVFVATGLQSVRSVDLGTAPEGVIVQGADFLDRVRSSPDDLSGQDVIVVGGGNTVMDAARSAKRLGARSVRILYRRTRAEMPAIAEEIDEALAEHIAVQELVMPLYLRRGDDHALLTCTRMRLDAPDESGRRRPVPEIAEDAQFELRCHKVILALGQDADLSILPEGSAVHNGDVLLGLTTAPVFAGGDLATQEGTVAAAIGSGRRAAWAIHRSLTGENLSPTPETEVASAKHVVMHVFQHAPRTRGRAEPPQLRESGFAEVHRGIADSPSHDAATAEAARCFSCGVCNACDRCLTWCPEGILRRDGSGYRFDYDYCKGCGICATQCPRGVIYMSEL